MRNIYQCLNNIIEEYFSPTLSNSKGKVETNFDVAFKFSSFSFSFMTFQNNAFQTHFLLNLSASEKIAPYLWEEKCF